MSKLEDVGKKLDSMGWTLVNMIDQVDGQETPALDWNQVEGLVADFEEAIEQYKTDLETLRATNIGIRARALAQGEALARVYSMVRPGEEVPQDVVLIAEAVQRHIQSANELDIEITDTLVNDVALGYFGASVIYNRDQMRQALANALQTR